MTTFQIKTFLFNGSGSGSPRPRIDNGQLIIEGNNSWGSLVQANFGQDNGVTIPEKLVNPTAGFEDGWDDDLQPHEMRRVSFQYLD